MRVMESGGYAAFPKDEKAEKEEIIAKKEDDAADLRGNVPGMSPFIHIITLYTTHTLLSTHSPTSSTHFPSTHSRLDINTNEEVQK